MKTLGYYNGKYGEIEDMTIPMTDRVHWFGDGVYDAGPARNYHIFALDEHVDRLFSSASMLDILPPVGKEELKALLCDLVRRLDTGDQFVYFQLTRGATGLRKHIYEPDVKANLWITLTPMEMPDGKDPTALITAPDTRFFHCNIKTLNLIPSVMASTRAARALADECVLYRPGERVTECSHSNVHILVDGALKTAPTDELILPGITRAHLIRLCRAMDIPVLEEPFTVQEMLDADEILTTSSGFPLRRALSVDGKAAGGKTPALYEKLRRAVFEELWNATN